MDFTDTAFACFFGVSAVTSGMVIVAETATALATKAAVRRVCRTEPIPFPADPAADTEREPADV